MSSLDITPTQNENPSDLLDKSFLFTSEHSYEDLCEEVLEARMLAMNLKNGQDVDDVSKELLPHHQHLHQQNSINGGGDGSDSGLDIATPLNVCLHREEDESNLNGNISCDSSMISYSSDVCDQKNLNRQNSNYECVSENGSESSSVTGASTVVPKRTLIKKKVAVFEAPSTPTTAGQLPKIKNRTNVARTQSLTRPSPPNLHTRERAKSRGTEKQTPVTPHRSTSIHKPQKPDSLPSPLVTPSLQRVIQRTPSLSRARTPGTPSDEGSGKWAHVRAKVSTNTPRRGISTKKQKSVEDLLGRNSRSNSITRDTNRMTSSVIISGTQTIGRKSLVSKFTNPTVQRSPKKPAQPKTKIYHEISVQTMISNIDVNGAEFTLGLAQPIKVDAVETIETSTQSDIRDKELEALREQIRQLNEKQVELNHKLCEKADKVIHLEHQLSQEREGKIAVQRELHLNAERVLGMLDMARGTPTEEENCFDSFQMLESQIQWSGNELVEKKSEINKLRKLCRTLQVELDRSLSAQERFMEEKVSSEKDWQEMQDFLQYEKSVMSEALKETEVEMEDLKKRLESKDSEIKVLRDECRHLVRLNEQRRQENKLMQIQQSGLAGSSAALTGLHTRLDSLVEQLISTYNISDQDLEDVVFHNEAYTNSSNDGSPENHLTIEQIQNRNLQIQDQCEDLSPQRNQSFIAAVISAIKHATLNKKSNGGSKRNSKCNGTVTHPTDGNESDSTEMLDSETEPCLMMDNVLEDVTMPDTHSHNMVSSSHMMISQTEVPSEMLNSMNSVMSGASTNAPDESLQNLSQAITNRQQMEFHIQSFGFRDHDDNLHSVHDSIGEMSSLQDFCSTNQQQAVVEQIISVDNLVTKLLKKQAQQNKEELLEKIKDLQDVNVKLQDELMDATQELLLKSNDLSSSKSELQRHRNEIDVRF
uniref:Uncharacterized protein n=1 Tax=Megaselia scalaris TaxID=36166 RepID=T1GFD4_MEGSC